MTILNSIFVANFMHRAVTHVIENKLPVSICLVNSSGQLLAQQNIMLPGFREFTETIARFKAKQAVHVGRRTSYIRDQVDSDILTPELMGINPQKYVPFAGGCPIYLSTGELIGGLGISGLDQVKDEEHCIHLIENSTSTELLSDRPK